MHIIEYLHTLTVHDVMDLFAYWIGFWTLVSILLPPRELVNSPRYDKFLQLVSYYGSLNRKDIAAKLYKAAGQDEAK